MRDIRDERAERHRELDAEVTCEVGDDLAERPPAVVRLDADEQDRIAIGAGDARAVERVLRPLDLPCPTLLERDHRTRRLEVDEELRVDVRELLRPPEPREIAGRERGSLPAVVPSAKCADEDGPLERRRSLVDPELTRH